ncbi:MAG: sigma-70 family RNA polymerase sigma factor [Bacilli bacterium]|nr:sigma-70 family RNA polymerase sigma factor [Bacilli bacterium]
MGKISGKTLRGLKSDNSSIFNASFQCVYSEYLTLIVYTSFCIVRNIEDARDIAQNVFLKLLDERKNIEPKKSLKAYLTITAKNMSINFKKKMERQVDIDFEPESEPETHYKDDFVNLLDAYKNYLDEEEITLVTERLLYGYKFEEISKELNRSVDSITSKYNRAIKKLQKHKDERGMYL